MPSVNDDGWLTAGPTDPAEVRAFYDEWANRYDADLADWDYRAPGRIADLLAEHADLGAGVLDAGCGTGLSGRALRDAGFTGAVIGVDLSASSLEVADASGAYTQVQVASLNAGLPFDDGSFGALACIGVLTYVPDVERAWREFCRLVADGGVVAFTQREDTWIERDCAATLDRLAADGVWAPIEVSDPEPYLPGLDDEMGDIGAHYVACRVL
jgi:predicted TPR repeat methyltransferase